MKKIYINPKTEIVEIELQQMIANSLKTMNEEGGDVDLFSTSISSEVEGESRQSNGFWDD